MSPEISAEIQKEQEHGRMKWGGHSHNLDHDDSISERNWHDYIENHNERARLGTPMERRQHLIKVAGLAISAIEAYDRTNAEFIIIEVK